MANNFAYNPYPEYNVNGDSANGKLGSLQPGAVTNQVDQSKPNTGGGNPYGDILKYLMPKPAAATPPAQPPAPRPAATLAAAPPTPQTQTTPPLGTPQTASTEAGHIQPSNPPAAPQNPYSGNIAPDVWQNTVRWGQMPGYEWLLDGKGGHAAYGQYYINDAMQMAGQGQQDITFADWLHHFDPNAPNPDYMKNGYDTWQFANPDDAKNGVTRQSKIDANNASNQNPDIPPDADPSQVQSMRDYWAKTHPNGQPFPGLVWNNGGLDFKRVLPSTPIVDPLVLPPNPTTGTGTGTGTGTTPPAGGTPPPSGGGTPPPTGTGTGTGTGIGTGTGTTPPTGTPPGAGTPPTGTAGGPTPPQWELVGGTQNHLDTNALINAVHGMYDPQFQQEREDFRRQMNAQAALTGDINSGGYQETYGRNLQRLMAGESQQMAGATENALNRASDLYKAQLEASGQKYGIDADLFAKQITDATQRFGIQTNADLQKWLDQNDNELKKYGIDKNDLLERYRAQLALQGQQASASAAVQSASLQAAAQQAAAAAQLQASKYATDAQSQAAHDQYNLGLANLSWDQYAHDNPGLLDILKLYANMSPEQMAALGLGQIPWQNFLAIGGGVGGHP